MTIPRASKTRLALLQAGLELFAEKPVDAVPVDEVVALAGVAKGSFFNHFADKQSFAQAVAYEVRVMIEALVDAFNRDIDDPIERIVGGMIVAAAFAHLEPRRSRVLNRASHDMISDEHPLNRGLMSDMRGAIARRQLAPEAQELGALYWMGCCHTLMTNIVNPQFDQATSFKTLENMARLGLRGLGVGDPILMTVAHTQILQSRFAQAQAAVAAALADFATPHVGIM